MKLRKLIAAVMFVNSMNVFAGEEVMKVVLASKNTDKGVCTNVCEYACVTDYCVAINGEEICKESCKTVCEYICE